MPKTIVFCILIFLLQTYNCYAQKNTLVLPDSGRSIESIIPNNWKILGKARGDLNHDGRKDLAFVIQDTDSSFIKKNKKGIGANTINSNPRTIAIYFKDKILFVKKYQSNTFIVHRASPTMMEPFGELSIKKDGDLDIMFHIWFNAGSWSRTIHHFVFQFTNGKFRLIQHKKLEVMRNTGKIKDTNLNFLKDSLIVREGNISSNTTKTVKAKKLGNDSLRTFESIKKPFDW